MRYAWLSGFRSESMVSLLSVYIVAVRGLPSSVFSVSIASRALLIASCSAWLFEHRLSNLNLICFASLVPINLAAPDPTPCSPLLPNIYAWMAGFLLSSDRVILGQSAGCGQSVYFKALSIS
jgi:hypothetical protein